MNLALLKEKIDYDHMPRHIAIIMDGNGRWAQQKGLPRIAGHRAGIQTMKKIVSLAHDIGVKILSLYAFSTENWKRPAHEVSFLMSLPQKYLAQELSTLIKKDIKITTCGFLAALPAETRQAIEDTLHQTKDCKGMILNFAINYGGRAEIVRAVKRLVKDVIKEKIAPDQISEIIFSSYLYTKNLPDPDLLIRSSGEMRLSNFFLWQMAYTELWFTKKNWPDFKETDFLQAILSFQQRQRRFGGVNTPAAVFKNGDGQK
jgi:undecaprenyl diphosphate synthase